MTKKAFVLVLWKWVSCLDGTIRRFAWADHKLCKDTSLLPSYLQNLGRNWITQLEVPQAFCSSSDISSCLWWAGHSTWAPYPHINTWHSPVGWRPPLFLGPLWSRFPAQNLHPCNGAQASHLQMSSPSMEAKEEEPLLKRRKQNDHETSGSDGGRSSPNNLVFNRSQEDVRVPPPHEASVLPVPSSTECEAAHPAGTKGIVKRHWEDFCQHYKGRSDVQKSCINSEHSWRDGHFDFSVMSYNILSQDLLEDNSHLYKHCRQPVLIWSYRLPNILRELKELDADILCLQEVQEDHYRTQIKPSLESLGYQCEYKMRTGHKPDGCAICFKLCKFTLLSSNPVEFYRRDIPLLDRDNIGLVLLLQPRIQGISPAICVANTHLLYNPRRGDIKLTQLAILLAEIAAVALQKDGGFCPIILCGDFNSVPGSPLHSFIREGKLDYEGLTIGKVSGQDQYPRGQRILSIPIWPPSLGISQSCVYVSLEKQKTEITGEELDNANLEKTTEETSPPTKQVMSNLQHHFSLSSVYSHYLPESGIPEVTTCHSRSAVTVDYIFYSPAMAEISEQPGADDVCRGVKLLGRLSLLTEQELWSVNGLPNEHSSSDHLPLLAKFRLEL
ncbi:protein angel homolog 2 isoform X2 [Rhinatrema bivittatum]|uniref:protein angel homolog 2 isoform X2 n=1 Tax=Rhinatrema bivittatum TaxID=194408 RepID=UPI00112D1AA1|nr:protein angel homolog 2 isoform X2 [Rhinatrema bivittatum]